MEQDAAYIVAIIPEGAAFIDKRLKVFDRISEIEGKKITADMSSEDLKKLFKRRYVKVTLLIDFLNGLSLYLFSI